MAGPSRTRPGPGPGPALKIADGYEAAYWPAARPPFPLARNSTRRLTSWPEAGRAGI
ncbi:MAG: hypothetical protein MPJ22_13230 [Pirellulales bacterium]|nr:hypothetical protein [Pirellulales bacterium]